MPTLHSAKRAAKNLLIAVLLLSTIIVSISANTLRPVQANSVTASPGKYDLALGNSTSLVKLSYPNSTILTDSVGDLLFTIILEPNSTSFRCDVAYTSASGKVSPLQLGDCQVSVNIYISPEFSGLSIGNIWTSFTNDYDSHYIRLSRQSSADQIAPDWWEVSIQNLNVTCTPWLANPSITATHPNPVFLAYPTCPELGVAPAYPATYQTKPQYVRLFQVTSPTTAGRYFFKTFINGQPTGNPPSANSFPTLVVKASRDPATISGTLRDLGNRIPSRAGQPIYLAPGMGAEVIATGYDPLGRRVSAQAFINSTADGSYTLFGVSPGTYNITVNAAGYIPITINQFPSPNLFIPSATKPITVASAQSLGGVDIYLAESPNVTGTILSETPQGTPIPWGCVVSFTTSAATQQECKEYITPTMMNLAPRAITVELISIADGTTVIATNQQPYTLPTTPSPFCTTGINCATNPTAIDYHYNIQNELSSWSGEIPETYANFTSGLPTGEDYFVRAYVTGYVQLAEVRAHTVNATAETEVPVPLIRTGIFNVTVHFKDCTCSELVDNPIEVSGTLSAYAYTAEGIEVAQNSTTVLDGSSSASIELQGISNTRQQGIFSQFSQNYGILPGCYYIVTRFTAAPPIIGNAATTTNKPVAESLVVGDLYYQTLGSAGCSKNQPSPSVPLACIGLGEGEVDISLPMYRAVGIQLHIYSIDTEVPPIYRAWAFPGNPVFLTFIPTTETTVYQTNTTQPGAGSYSIPEPPVPPPTYTYTTTTFTYTAPGLNVTGLLPGSYDLYAYTLGYTQATPIHFSVQLCVNADASVWMIVNPVISLTVGFRHEGLLTGINSTEPFAQPINNLPATPARVEVFDSIGNFVAANDTYIPNNSTSDAPTQVANFTLAGFGVYYGDPRYVWSGFYDTTDQVSQQSGGLLLYPWELSQPYHEFTIRVWVDGYYQEYPFSVIVATQGNVSATIMLDRASRISGTVAGPDIFNIARPQSWAMVDLEPNNVTLSGIIDVRPGNYTTTSLDDSFQVWVPQGTYGMGVSLEGYSSYQTFLVVPDGSDLFMWVWLENYQSTTTTNQTLALLSSPPMAA